MSIWPLIHILIYAKKSIKILDYINNFRQIYTLDFQNYNQYVHGTVFIVKILKVDDQRPVESVTSLPYRQSIYVKDNISPASTASSIKKKKYRNILTAVT
jgi:hypothetical protein